MKFASAALFMLIGVAGVPAHRPAGSPAEQPARDSTLVRVVEADAEDKGSVPVGERVVRHVTVLNVSRSPIRLSVKTKSCACLDPKAQPEVIGPGETSLLTFGVMAVGTSGQQRFTTTFLAAELVDEGARHVQDISASLRYKVSFDWLVKPARVSAVVLSGDPVDMPLYLQTLAKDELSPRVLSCSIEGISVTSEERPLLDSDNAVWVLHARGQISLPGIHEGQITVGVEGKAKGAIKVPVVVRVLPAWVASPPGVVLDVRTADGPRTVELKLVDQSQGRTPAPAGVRTPPGLAGISVTLSHDQAGPRLMVNVDAVGVDAPTVKQVEVLDKDGAVLCTVPIVLYRPTDAAGPGRR